MFSVPTGQIILGQATVVIDDIYAARKFIEILDINIVNDNGIIYFFNEDNGMWNSDDITYRQLIIKHKDKLIFYDFFELFFCKFLLVIFLIGFFLTAINFKINYNEFSNSF